MERCYYGPFGKAPGICRFAGRRSRPLAPFHGDPSVEMTGIPEVFETSISRAHDGAISRVGRRGRSSRNALSAVQAAAVAGQLMVVPGNSICLWNLPSAQLKGVVSVRISRITQVGTKVLPASYLRLAPLGSSWLTLVVERETAGIVRRR